MATVPSPLVRWVISATGRNRTYLTEEGARRRIAEAALKPEPYAPPWGLRPEVEVRLTQRHGWPVATMRPLNLSPHGALVYAHGGGWVSQITVHHWRLLAQICAEANVTVTVPIYPKLPFGSSVPVVVGFADFVRDSVAAHGPTCLAGDSAGGQIALSTALTLRDTGVVLPRTILISPALDLRLENPDVERVQSDDPWLGIIGGRVLGREWAAGVDVTDPAVSPLFGDFTGLGPITVFSGTHDILHPDALLLVERARAAGVDVEYVEEPGHLHVFPLLPTAEGREARTLIVNRIGRAVGSETAQPDR